jgi:anti-sigma B factor antagonist
MTFQVTTVAPGVLRITIEGELDVATVASLREGIDKFMKDEKPTRVELDLGSLRMVDSSGVGALVSLYKRVNSNGGTVVITGLRDQPLAIFRLLRLDRVMLGSDLPGPPQSSSSKG